MFRNDAGRAHALSRLLSDGKDVAETQLTRYWISFAGIGRWPVGCGVTASSVDDAFNLVRSDVLEPMGITEMPEIERVIENVDVSTLDAWNVLPHVVRPPNWRGVWYPASTLR